MPALPRRLDGDTLLVPAVFELTGDDGTQTLAEGATELNPGDDGYDDWDAWMTARDQAPDGGEGE